MASSQRKLRWTDIRRSVGRGMKDLQSSLEERQCDLREMKEGWRETQRGVREAFRVVRDTRQRWREVERSSASAQEEDIAESRSSLTAMSKTAGDSSVSALFTERTVEEDHPPTTPWDGVSERMLSLVEALRRTEVSVSPSQVIDAARAMSIINVADRQEMREALAATLIHRPEHRRIFDQLFDLWFLSDDPLSMVGEKISLPVNGEGEIDRDAVHDLITEALLRDPSQDEGQLQNVIEAVVDQMGRYQSSKGDSFSSFQAITQLNMEGLTARLLAGLLAGLAGTSEESHGVTEAFAHQRIRHVEELIHQETVRRVAQIRGAERVAKYSVRPSLDISNIGLASPEDLWQMRREVVNLARLLATRLSVTQKTGSRRSIDLRKTLHRASATAGVPITLVRKKPQPKRPELVVLCDISGSVASFSQFTLLLVYALQERFSRVRAFAFVDRIDEITHLFTESEDLADLSQRALQETKVMGQYGHSDYGQAFGMFLEEFESVLTRNTSVLVLGDGRTNHLNPNLDAVREIVSAVKHAHWLNPESQQSWGKGDSAADRYQDVIPMHECRNGRQLAEFITQLLKSRK